MIHNIQVLRAIAALMVVYFHTIGALNSYYPGNTLTENLFFSHWGAYGVDVFFVISGFIMVYTNSFKKRSPLAFIKDRIKRVVPLYWIFTAIFVLLYFIFPAAFRQKTLIPADIIGSFFFYQYIIRHQDPVLIPGWTLEFEMLFYLVFSLSLFAKKMVQTVLISSLALCLLLFTGLDHLILEFVLGMGLALLYLKFPGFRFSRTGSYLALLTGMLLLILGAGYWVEARITVITGALLLFAGFLYFRPIKHKIALLLGNASYSLYLIQTFTIPLFFKLWTKLPFAPTLFSQTAAVISCLVFTCIAAVISYRLIEQPLARLWAKKSAEQVSPAPLVK